jgi:hypothetical protein
MSQQQTVLRVETNLPGSIVGLTEWSSGTTYGSDVLVSYNNLTYVSIRPDNTNNTPIVGGSLWWDEVGRYEFLDLYSSIPLLINKSFAELGDIGKRNSDYSVGVLLPGSKRNNAFFESYFNVDSVSFFFNPNKRVPCNVLINDEPYFTGYMRLNKVSVMESKAEYDVTLYSTPAELYGSIGNNLLRDLNFSDDDYRFNHTFNLNNVTKGFTYPNYAINGENPYPYFYPVVHNGYLYYTGDTVNFSDGFIKDRTNLYTSTAPLGSFATLASAYAAGVQQHRINSPTQGLYNNQLKPALNIWSLLQLMFKTYGFSIESDFFNTPWMKTLYLYGYFSSDTTKFGYTVYSIQTLPLEGCEVFFVEINLDGTPTVYSVVCKLGTGIPCYCSSDINVTFHYSDEYNPDYTFDATIPYGTSGLTIGNIGLPFNYGTSSQVPNGTTLKYLPVSIGDTVSFVDDDFVDFNLVIDQNIKQIDILSSIAKKFNLVLIPDPNNGYNIRIEPYDYYIGTGKVHNWSDKISYDKGFTVEPALNFIESELRITDQQDNDEGNKLFKESNNRIYGQNYVYNPTDFKTEVKEINTIFSPELIRKWDADGESNIGLPLGINYVGSNNQIASGTSERVNWIYKGVKTKPKLFWWLGSFNPFLDLPGEHYDATYFYKTYVAYIMNSSGTTYNQYDRIPVISHTMPMGNPDSNKSGRGFENDSQCILFNSELPANTDIGVQPFNTYTENDAYTSFYEGRVSNLYNPNTRVLSGYFNLNYADLKNLEPQDLIKINEQYFVVSKIEGFNLTNRELTKVQLVQFNGQPNTYPTRCFEYYYCDDPTTVYTFSTDFTNSNLLDTNFGWSLYYDHQIGNLGGSATGFTSTFKDVENFSTEVYIPYYIYEVKCGQTTGALDWGCDCLHNYIWSEQYGPFQYNMPSFWLNSDSTETGVNLFTDCADFYTTATTYDIVTGSSSNRGNICCITPTPTPTPTQTITPTPTMTPTMTPTPTISPSPTPTPTPEPPGKYVLTNTAATLTGATRYSSNTLLSTNYGSTWTKLTPPYNIGYACINDNGQYIYGIASDGYIYKATNLGTTWTKITSLGGTANYQDWIDIDCSSNGQYVTATYSIYDPNFIHYVVTSSDYGVTWNQIYNPDLDIPSGTQGYGYPYKKHNVNRGYGVPQYFAGNYGSSQPQWLLKMSSISASGSTMTSGWPAGSNIGSPFYINGVLYWYQIKASNDTKYIAAITDHQDSTANQLYLSTNSGSTWSLVSAVSSGTTLGVSQIDISNDGQYMYVATSSDSGFGLNGIWVSTNYGSTWTFTAIGGSNTKKISCSSDGQYVYVVADGGATTGYYVSINYGSTFTLYTNFAPLTSSITITSFINVSK